jgi:hypothetical protein
MRKIIFILLGLTFSSAFSAAWEGPFTIKEIQFDADNQTNKGIVIRLNENNYDVFYDPAATGHSYEDMKTFMSIALAVKATSTTAYFYIENVGTTNTRLLYKIKIK